MRKRKQPGAASRKKGALDRLTADEAATVLRLLLEKRPDTKKDAEILAKSVIGGVSVEAVSDDVEAAVDMLDLDDLNNRAGSHSHGYVEPTEAAWELVGEAVTPFIEDIRRRVETGEHAAALTTCAGVVLGLYRLRDKGGDEFLGWAVDSPDEFAGEAIVTLRKALRASKASRATSDLPAVLREVAPEWAEMLERCWRHPV